jgi:hypothetical protein
VDPSDLPAYMQSMHAREDLLYLRETANGMQICSWRIDQARWATYMHSMHEASLQHVQKEKGKLGFSRQQSSRNATDRLCYDCDRKRCSQRNKENGYKVFSHAVWDWDVGSPELLRAQCVGGQRQRGFWKCANKHRILSSALPSQSMERECIVMLNNAMLAYGDVKKR